MKAAERLEAIQADGKKALADLKHVLSFIDDNQPDAGLRVLMVNSVIVGTVSVVEEILRQLFIEYLTIVEKSIDSHKKLRGTLRDINTQKYVENLRKLVKEKNEIDAIKLLDELRRCLNGEQNYHLAKEAISYNKGNFRSDQLTEIAKNIGLSEVWMKISDDATVSEYTGITVGKPCVTKLIYEWNLIYDERDLVVHRISQANGWSAQRVMLGIDLFLLVLDRFTYCLTQDLLSAIPPEMP